MDHFGSISTDKSLIVGETVKKEINVKLLEPVTPWSSP